jgi:hypothetical protein
MLTQQQFYNNVCNLLRTYGNPYGSYIARQRIDELARDRGGKR